MTKLTRREFSRLAAGMAAAGFCSPLFAEGGLSRSLPPYAGPLKPLFNGRNLTGWSFYQDGVGTTDTTDSVVVESEVIHMLGPRHKGGDRPGFGHIATEGEYGNYHLRLEFKFGEKRFEPRLLAKRNSGVLYHMFPQRYRVWPNSVELQLQESDVGDAILINTRCYPGADLGGTPAWPDQRPDLIARPKFPSPAESRPEIERQLVRKNGDFEKIEYWNTIELLAIEDRAAQLVNGRIVNTLYELVGQDLQDRNSYHPLTKGRIGLEIEGAEVFFRNVEIRNFATNQ